MAKPEVVLEIGVGANDFEPVPTMLVGFDVKVPPQEFENDRIYIGVDMPLEPNRFWRDIHAWFVSGESDIDEKSKQSSDEIAASLNDVKNRIANYRDTRNVNFMVTDGENLPLPSASVGEVYLGNVIGSQMRDENVENLLREARRVLKANGRIVIREDITPHWVPDDWEAMLKRAGFEGSVQRFNFGTEAYNAMVERYGQSGSDVEPDLVLKHDCFFAIAEASTNG